MKRRSGVVFALMFVIIFMSAFVSAGPAENVQRVIESTIRAADSVFSPIFSRIIGDTGGGDLLFPKILLFILLWLVINAVLGKVNVFGKNRRAATLVSFIVSLLSVRYMSDFDFIRGVLLPYGTLGVAITTVLPFIIFFYFLHSSNVPGFMRRLGWVVFFIIFSVMWAFNEGVSEQTAYIYGFTLLAIIVAFIFDKSIQRYFGTHELAVWKRGANQKIIAGLQSEYLNILHVDTNAAESRRRAIEHHIVRLGGDLP